jgi:hypothetical protein
LFGAIALGTCTILADAHIDHLNLDVRLLYLPALLFAVFGGQFPLVVGVFLLFEAFAVSLILAVVGDVDGGGIAAVAVGLADWTQSLEVLLVDCDN